MSGGYIEMFEFKSEIFFLLRLHPTEGLSSGQVAGIVIGALLAVVIVIAVLIVVARRMGKYS